MVEEVQEFVVERIVSDRVTGGVHYFEVKWEGFDDAQNTWEPEQNLSHCEYLLNLYLEEKRASGCDNEVTGSSDIDREYFEAEDESGGGSHDRRAVVTKLQYQEPLCRRSSQRKLLSSNEKDEKERVVSARFNGIELMFEVRRQNGKRKVLNKEELQKFHKSTYLRFVETLVKDF